MEKSSFFNSVNGDRRYKAEDYAAYFASFIGDGVFPNPSNNLQVISNNNMTITIKQGRAWINGYFYWNTSDLILNVDVADGVLNRIDRVVLRLDYLNREMKAYIKKGVFASSPVAPTLQRDSDVYELALADISINKGAVSITQANISDKRLDKNLCGVVHGVVEQIDLTTLFNQYTEGFKLKEQGFEQQFQAWFDTVKGQLSGDVAGNLTNEITNINSKLGNETLTTTKQTVTGAVNEVKSELAQMATDKAEKLDLGNKTLLKTTAKTDLVSAVNELFTNANNIKSDWAGVIGSPLLATDTSAQLKSKTQTLKNTMATNLTAKGQASVGTDSLSNLINKISNISTEINLPKPSLTDSVSGLEYVIEVRENIIITGSASGSVFVRFYNKSNGVLLREIVPYSGGGVLLTRDWYAVNTGANKYEKFNYDGVLLEDISSISGARVMLMRNAICCSTNTRIYTKYSEYSESMDVYDFNFTNVGRFSYSGIDTRLSINYIMNSKKNKIYCNAGLEASNKRVKAILEINNLTLLTPYWTFLIMPEHL